MYSCVATRVILFYFFCLQERVGERRIGDFPLDLYTFSEEERRRPLGHSAYLMFFSLKNVDTRVEAVFFVFIL
jgi:hypothetical protein